MSALFSLAGWSLAAAVTFAQPFDKLAADAAKARDENRVDDAIALYRKALAVRPAWAEGWWEAGVLHYDRDQYPECAAAFEKLTALQPKAGPAHAFLGLCQFKLAQYAKSFEHLNLSRELGLAGSEHLSEVVFYHNAILLNRDGNFEGALRLLGGAARGKAASPKVLLAAGIAGLRERWLPDQVPDDKRALAVEMGRALTLAIDRRQAEAAPIFEKLVAENPTTPHLHYAYAQFLLLGRPDRAIEEFEKELALDADHLPSLISLVSEYLRRGEVAKARPYAERAVKSAPSNFTARASLGRVLVASGEVAPGIAHLEEAAKLAPDNPQTRIFLASAYAKAGRSKEAARERAEFQKLRAKQVEQQQ